jgi:GAF domain-containing protein
VVKVMDVKASLLRLMNMKSKTLDVVAHFGLSDAYVFKGTIKFDKSITDALEGKSVSVYDITADHNSQYYKNAMAEGFRSILSIPLRYKNEVIGVLRMYTAEPMNYNAEDIKFVEAIAEQAAIAIVNARHFESIVDKEKEYLRLFQEVSKAVSSTSDIDEVFQMIVKKISEAMKVKAVTIRLVDIKTGELYLAASYGLSKEYLAKGPVDKEINIMEALNERPVAIYDASTDERVIYREEAKRENIKSMLVVPIKVKDKIIGVLRLLTNICREFTITDINFATALAEQCGIAIVNAQMFEKKYKEIQYLRTIREITSLIIKNPDFSETLPIIVMKLPMIMNTSAASLKVLNPVTGKLDLVAASGLNQKYLLDKSVNISDDDVYAISIEYVKSKKWSSKDGKTSDVGTKSIMNVPLIVHNKMIGLLSFLTYKKREFSSDEIDFASALADVVALGINNARKG